MIVANRYAQSLMDLASEQKKVDAVRADMKLVAGLCLENREFALFLNSPVIKTDKKLEVLNAIFQGKVSDLSLAFIQLVAKKHRESVILDIAQSFDELYKKNQNIFSAVVTTASGLDAATKAQVLDLVKAQLKGEVELEEKIDADTIGGFILTMGDRQLDRSVARQLSTLKKELINNSN
jgi:F-type H+-transporting ATPase subunit delta